MDYEPIEARRAIAGDSAKHRTPVSLPPQVPFRSRRWPTLIAPVWVIESVEHGAQISDASIRKAREVIEIHADAVRRAVAAGVKVAMGTDAGVGPHGDNLRELGLLERAGMTPTTALQSATQEAARLLGVDETLGTIEEGKTADLVVVGGDPLQFDGWAGRVEQVWLGGTRRV